MCRVGGLRKQQDQPIFRTGTRLIVQTVTVKDRNGNPVEGLTARDFIVTEDGEPQDIASSSFSGCPMPRAPAGARSRRRPPRPARRRRRRRPSPRSRRSTQAQLRRATAGRHAYRDRRLLVLYFDLSAMPPDDQMRAYQAALKFVDTQMAPADLVAIITYQGGAVRVKQDFTDDRALLQEVIAVLIFGDDKDGDGVPRSDRQAPPSARTTASSTSSTPTASWRRCRRRSRMLRPLPEQKSLSTSPAACG